ncbi:Homeodomain-like protein, partial [Basidiobolus meristosporus CBS 931.73]
MFETFHQTPHGEFRTSFYNPFEVKHRKRTTRTQFTVLEKAFQENAKPNSAVRKELAQQLNMTPRGVQVWFQNRRAKAK